MPDYSQEDLIKRGLIRNDYHLPYNPKLIQRAKDLRRNMTREEKLVWEKVLKPIQKMMNIRILRQRPIDNYIVDFYCPKYCVVIEIDGEVHNDNKEYDDLRTITLSNYDLRVIRFRNSEVCGNLAGVENKIIKFLKSSPFSRGTEGD